MKRGVMAVAAVGVFWAMLGMFEDREHGDRYLFLKHRPTYHFYFTSPVGESDKIPEDSADVYREELFHEYVERNGGFRRSVLIPFL